MVIQNSINQALGLGALAAKFYADTPTGQAAAATRQLKAVPSTEKLSQELDTLAAQHGEALDKADKEAQKTSNVVLEPADKELNALADKTQFAQALTQKKVELAGKVASLKPTDANLQTLVNAQQENRNISMQLDTAREMRAEAVEKWLKQRDAAAAESRIRQTAELSQKSFGDSLATNNITRDEFYKKIGGLYV